MNNNDIKHQIRELKKEEQLQLQKLENIKKNETKAFHLANSKTISTIIDFQSKLNELSNFYQRTNMIDFDNKSNFISEHELTLYEQQEKDISELLEKKLELDFSSLENGNLINDENESDLKFQESLYLLHEAEMSSIALEAEMASLDAQILYLMNPSKPTKQLKTNEECDKEINELNRTLSETMKEICKNKVLLEMKPDLERNLETQLKSAKFMHQIVEQYNKQLHRQNMRIEALNKELEIHKNVENVFDSISIIVDELDKLQEHMDNMTDMIDSLKEPQLSKDEQLVIRMKSYSDEKEFQTIFESIDSVKCAYIKEKDERSDTLEKLMRTFENSFVQFEKIYKSTEEFSEYVKENSCNHWNNRLTIMNKTNSDLLNSIDPNRFTERIKQMKEALESIKVDIMIK